MSFCTPLILLPSTGPSPRKERVEQVEQVQRLQRQGKMEPTKPEEPVGGEMEVPMEQRVVKRKPLFSFRVTWCCKRHQHQQVIRQEPRRRPPQLRRLTNPSYSVQNGVEAEVEEEQVLMVVLAHRQGMEARVEGRLFSLLPV